MVTNGVCLMGVKSGWSLTYLRLSFLEPSNPSGDEAGQPEGDPLSMPFYWGNQSKHHQTRSQQEASQRSGPVLQANYLVLGKEFHSHIARHQHHRLGLHAIHVGMPVGMICRLQHEHTLPLHRNFGHIGVASDSFTENVSP